MISIVIPNFNGAKLLERNLPKLLEVLAKSRLDYEVILADDASTDKSLEVANKFGLKMIDGGNNVGFAGNIDRGIRAAKGEIVFTLKTDVLPENSDYFRLMLDHFKDPARNASHSDAGGPKVFAVSAALKTTENGKEEIRGCGEIYFEKGFFLHRRKPVSSFQYPATSSWADGGAMAVRKDLYLKIGGFDPLYNPFYWEDTDLGFRAWKAGYQIAFEPRAILLHDYESGAIAQHYTKEQVQIISQRNQFIFVWKNGDLKHLFLYAIWKAYHAVVALKNANWTYFQALWQAFLLWPRILAARYQQKKVTRLTDDQALGIISLT